MVLPNIALFTESNILWFCEILLISVVFIVILVIHSFTGVCAWRKRNVPEIGIVSCKIKNEHK